MKQTEELFRNGKVTSGGGRATTFADGTAFVNGNYPSSGMAFANGYGGHAVGENDDKFEETFDWLAILLSRLERTIDNFDKTANNVSKSWITRDTALTNEINAVKTLIDEIGSKDDDDSIAGKYWDKAAEFLSHDNDLARKIRGEVDSGLFNIELYKDDTGEADLEKIKEYQKWYELYLDMIDKAKELKQTEAELWVQRFDNVVSEYDDILQGFEHTEAMLDEYINQAEAKGRIVSKEYYDALKTNKQSEINKLIEEQSALITKRNEAEANGIDKNSRDWYNMCAEIDGVTQAIEAGRTALIEYDNATRDIDWDNLDLAREKMSRLNEEADFFIELMSNDDLFDDNGDMNEKGLTTAALHFANRDVYKGTAANYATEIDDLNNQIDTLEAAGDYDQNLINRRDELLEAQRECILAAEQEEDAIKDLISEGYDKQLEALQDRIDLYNESVESAKDLYDYEKNISEQVQNIAALEKQLRAYEGFNNEETRATVQKLKVELEKANADLEESQYDKFISDQSALLDELYLEYETALNERLDNDVALLQEKLGEVNANLGKDGAINTTLSGIADGVGVKISDEFTKIWTGDGKGAEGVTLLDNVNKTLTDIAGNIQTLVTNTNTEAKENIEQPKTPTSAASNPTGSSGGGSKPSSSYSGSNKSTGGDGKPKIGDKVKFLSGKYYYDSQGVNPAGSKYQGKQVYITNINKKKWATHPYHISTGKKLGSGDLGWLKLNQISGYATGKKNFLNDEIAWTQENGQEFIVRPSDGAILTPIAKGDSVLTSAASSNIWDMANSPADFIKDNLNLGTANVPNNSTVQSNYTQNLDKVVFNFPNVRNYDEMLSAMQKDKNFERLVMSMTIDQIAGKSSLAKGKSIR